MDNKKVFIWVALIAIIAVLVFHPLRKGNDEEITISKDFSNVELESDNAEVQVYPIKGDEALIKLENNEKNRYSLEAKVKGSTLEIEVERRGLKWFSIDFFSKSPLVTVGLPRDEYDTIKVENNNGKIQVSELELKELVAETNNGEIIINDIQSKKLNVDTDNGSIVIEDSNGIIKGHSDNGKITVVADKLAQPMDLETDNGQIFVKTKGESKDTQFNVKTDNGKISIYGQSTTEKVIGNGNTIIKLKSDNGNITVE